MAGDTPGRPPVGRLLDVLRVRRNAAVGFAVGAVLGATFYAVRVLELLGPAPDEGSALLFLGLAFVLAVSAGGLLTTALTAVTAARVARDPDAATGGEEN